MKISIIGLHYVIQTLTLKDKNISTDNLITNYDLKHESTLLNLALALKQADHNVDVMANFNATSLSMRVLKQLEEEEIIVYPDLQDNNHQKIQMKQENTLYTFNDATPLKLINTSHLEESSYIISNIDDYDLFSQLSTFSNAKVIILDKLPLFRTLNFVDAIVFDKLEVSDDSISSLLQNGVSWVAIKQEDSILFRTLKNTIELNLNDINQFIAQFLKAMQSHTLIEWLDSTKK